MGVIGGMMREMGECERGMEMDGGGEMGDDFRIEEGRGVVMGERWMMGKKVKV